MQSKLRGARGLKSLSFDLFPNPPVFFRAFSDVADGLSFEGDFGWRARVGRKKLSRIELSDWKPLKQ